MVFCQPGKINAWGMMAITLLEKSLRIREFQPEITALCAVKTAAKAEVPNVNPMTGVTPTNVTV